MARLHLNPSQQAVVQERAPRIVVMAGAGTGKTATTVHHVASLIRDGVCRSQVLMITFTRKAANEMQRRVNRLVDDIPLRKNEGEMTVGTYHAVGIQLLREDPKGFGFSNRTFSIIDDSESLALWKSAYKECGITNGDALCLPAKISEIVSFCHNTCAPLEYGLGRQWVGQGEVRTLMKVCKTYEQLKRTAHAVDYDDLLVMLRDRLGNDATYREKLRKRFTHVIVDEVQDNSQLNYAILKNLNPENLMVVGDVQQSIYGFRGASSELISHFARTGDAKLLKLEDNFRSGQKILNLANRIVSGLDFSLQLRSARQTDSFLDFRIYSNINTEAEGILKWVNFCVKEKGHQPCDVAILSRSSVNLTVCEAYLKAHRIRYKKYGGLALGDAAEVKDFISFLRVSFNRNDRLAMIRALTQFPGLGETTAESFSRDLLQPDSQAGNLFEVISWPKQAREMERWLVDLAALPKLADKGEYLKKAVAPLFRSNYPKDWAERMQTVETIVNTMKNFDAELADFLDAFTLDKNDQKGHPEDCIVLSTIHSSKGLEWPAVFIMGSGSMQMPHPRVITDDEMKEERRLMYVAVTRARDRLVLSYPQTQARKTELQHPSPLLPELPWRAMDDQVRMHVPPPVPKEAKDKKAARKKSAVAKG